MCSKCVWRNIQQLLRAAVKDKATMQARKPLLLEGLYPDVNNKDLKSGALIAMSRDKGTSFIYIQQFNCFWYSHS